MNHSDFTQFFKDTFKSPSAQFTQPADTNITNTRGAKDIIVTILTAHVMTAHHVPADTELLKTLPHDWTPCVQYAEYIAEFWRISMDKPRTQVAPCMILIYS